MSGDRSPLERSIDFSNSSSFSSVSDSSEENASIADHLQPLECADEAKASQPSALAPEAVIRPPPHRDVHADIVSIIHTEEEEEEEEDTPSPLVSVNPARFTRAYAGSDDDLDLLHSTIPGPSHRCSFSAARDSASPPTMSSYFCVAVETDVNEALRLSPVWERESFEEIPTPRSMASAALTRASPSSHLSPPASPVHARETREGSTLSLLIEAVAVNASHAHEAHERLYTFSTATMMNYQLVKLKVTQRIYRIYYDKWRARLGQLKSPVTTGRVCRDTQTPSAPLRSVSIGTDFADIESFHASRSTSAVSTPYAWAPSAHSLLQRQPSHGFLQDTSSPLRRSSEANQSSVGGLAESERHQMPLTSPLLNLSSPPARVHGGGGGGGAGWSGSAWSPSPSADRPPCSSSAHTPSPDARPTREWTPSPAPPLADGIAVRTKPAKLVDFGRRSDAPRRKSAHVSNPVVTEPKVVPSPPRIFRL